MTIEWRDKMSVDGGPIDEDHRHLIEIINQLEREAPYFTTSEDALEILHTLKFYCKTHFKREEDLQLHSSYTFHDAHAKEHKDLLHTLNHIIEETRTCDDKDIKKIGAEMAELLKNWLINHVLNSDLRMKPYVEEMKKHSREMGKLADVEN